MAELGFFLSSEEHGPDELIHQAQLAEAHGFASVWISDHFHPWLDDQGQSPFVWTVIGGIAATTSLWVTTAVTCPTIRIHPVVLAQAAATSAVLLEGRFRLGVGSGENLNEHVLGHRWPGTDDRLAMLEEAVAVMRMLWEGEQVTWKGDFYEVDRAQIYTLPNDTVPVPVSAFGPKALDVAARIGDGLASTSPDPESIETYRAKGGTGPSMAGVKIAYGPDETKAAELAHRMWRSSGVPGELSQELAVPAHFEQAAELVTVEQLAEKIPAGPDPERHAAAIRKYLEAGFDEVYVGQIGDIDDTFFRFFREEIEPRL
jgi:G6PDH family F420-dependent oxidoreductase